MHVVSVNTSPGGIPKLPRDRCLVTIAGLEGDGHNHEKHRSPLQAVSLIDEEILEAMQDEGHDLQPGMLGENLTLRGAAIQLLGLGDRLRFSSGLEIEITKVRPPCYVLDELDPILKKIMWNRIGMYARVLHEGEVASGDSLEIITSGSGPRPALREVPESFVDGTSFARRILGKEPA